MTSEVWRQNLVLVMSCVNSFGTGQTSFLSPAFCTIMLGINCQHSKSSVQSTNSSCEVNTSRGADGPPGAFSNLNEPLPGVCASTALVYLFSFQVPLKLMPMWVISCPNGGGGDLLLGLNMEDDQHGTQPLQTSHWKRRQIYRFSNLNIF